MFYFLVIISYFPVPLQWIYVVTETKEINPSNPDSFSKLGSYSHSHKSKLGKD